jgi:hypothetical protein
VEILVVMRQAAEGTWVARTRADLVQARAVVASGASRQECLADLRDALEREGIRPHPSEPLDLVVEVFPVLAGVAEAAAVMEWDKRRVVTYIDRGSFPAPLQALASGRVWARSDVEEFAVAWRAKQRARRERAARRASRPRSGSPP